MNIFKMLISNDIINICFISWFSAQIVKTLLVLITTKELNAERLVGAGGMPSSHSALVCSLLVAVLRVEGYSSTLFAIAFCIACIVMYDAMGVRRAAGEQAKVLNRLIKSIFTKDFNSQESYEALKEYLGHTPKEVLVGAIFGIVIGAVIPIS